jgi:predicted component of type VI protein secretion system
MDKNKMIWVGGSLLLLIIISIGVINNYFDIGDNNLTTPKVNNDNPQEEDSYFDEEEEDIEDVVSEEEAGVMIKIAEIEGYIVFSEETLQEIDRLKANPIIVSDIEENLERIKEEFVALDVSYQDTEVTDEQFQTELDRILSEAKNIAERAERLF